MHKTTSKIYVKLNHSVACNKLNTTFAKVYIFNDNKAIEAYGEVNKIQDVLTSNREPM